MLHSAESNFWTLLSRIAPRIRKYFRVLIRGLGAVDLCKKPEVENLVILSL
jgi:hypothetical protein